MSFIAVIVHSPLSTDKAKEVRLRFMCWESTYMIIHKDSSLYNDSLFSKMCMEGNMVIVRNITCRKGLSDKDCVLFNNISSIGRLTISANVSAQRPAGGVADRKRHLPTETDSV
ncbi:hypothetical protein sr17383 [Sporisorium reilianum SRZ2]|uniref:Uncharacterized protein n=1 Tax=Sporisorium reilianum (strain SRZ2) TaxID=999809 RepID=E6ZVY2_SPORE|nr:hypothetical protein sr17383 [Sporisorium reilianum SRZ2]